MYPVTVLSNFQTHSVLHLTVERILLKEKFSLLEYSVLSADKSHPMFRRNLLHPSSGSKSKPIKKQAWGRQRAERIAFWLFLLPAWCRCLALLTPRPWRWKQYFPRNVVCLSQDYTALYPRDRNPHSNRCDTLKSDILKRIWKVKVHKNILQ
jgi:hypothetical protein